MNEGTAEVLKGQLPKEDQTELFFYQHFTMREKTEAKSSDFIDGLLANHYEMNN